MMSCLIGTGRSSLKVNRADCARPPTRATSQPLTHRRGTPPHEATPLALTDRRIVPTARVRRRPPPAVETRAGPRLPNSPLRRTFPRRIRIHGPDWTVLMHQTPQKMVTNPLKALIQGAVFRLCARCAPGFKTSNPMLADGLSETGPPNCPACDAIGIGPRGRGGKIQHGSDARRRA